MDGNTSNHIFKQILKKNFFLEINSHVQKIMDCNLLERML